MIPARASADARVNHGKMRSSGAYPLRGSKRPQPVRPAYTRRTMRPVRRRARPMSIAGSWRLCHGRPTRIGVTAAAARRAPAATTRGLSTTSADCHLSSDLLAMSRSGRRLAVGASACSRRRGAICVLPRLRAAPAGEFALRNLASVVLLKRPTLLRELRRLKRYRGAGRSDQANHAPGQGRWKSRRPAARPAFQRTRLM